MDKWPLVTVVVFGVAIVCMAWLVRSFGKFSETSTQTNRELVKSMVSAIEGQTKVGEHLLAAYHYELDVHEANRRMMIDLLKMKSELEEQRKEA